jgi:thymidylate kinase
MESLGKDFLLRVKEGFLELALLNKNRYVIIDANKTIPEIKNLIWSQFKNRYLK